MPVQPYILALHQGTTSSRTILFDHAGQIVQIAQNEFKQYCPQRGQQASHCHQLLGPDLSGRE